MTHAIIIVFVLLLIVAGKGASETAPSPTPKHGEVPLLRLNERVSFGIRDQIFWKLSLVSNKAFSSGTIYYEHPRLQEPKMRRISLSMSSVTVREALNALVKADGSYSWAADGDVVNFIPKKRNKKLIDVVKTLNQIIPLYEVEGVDISDAIQELRKQAAAQGITGLPLLKDWGAARDPAWEMEGIFDLKLKNKTVRECLNAIVAADSPAYWIAIPFPDYVFIGAAPTHTHTGHLRKSPGK